MAVLERGLVRALNSGRCYALVGSGASCDVGLPDWRGLAEKTLSRHPDLMPPGQAASLLDKAKYPEFFGVAEQRLGLPQLLATVAEILTRPSDSPRGAVYSFLARWPFRCYLTTNFDDELPRHLHSENVAHVVRRNSQDDMALLHGETQGVVFKIHGDTTDPDGVVLTSRQFEEFCSAPNRQYWRDGLFACLKMMDIVAIGYRARDPDLVAQLERLKAIAAPDHPVYLFAADLPRQEVARCQYEHSIRVISYRTRNGSHSELQRLLARYDRFILKRGSPLLGAPEVDSEEARTAAALYLFTRLRLIDQGTTVLRRSYATLLLTVLSSASASDGSDLAELAAYVEAKTRLMSGVDATCLQEAVGLLHDAGLVSVNSSGRVALTAAGRRRVETSKAHYRLAEEQFEVACEEYLVGECRQLGKKERLAVIAAAKEGLMAAFDSRGMEIARQVFVGQAIQLSDAHDFLDTLNGGAANLETHEQRGAFADLALEVILEPSPQMREYLACLCQGYFTYHALGLDPKCSDERLLMARKSLWVLDSSVILPVLALDCQNHQYAKDLLENMQAAGLRLVTTTRILKEVLDHAYWAVTKFRELKVGSIEFLNAATAGPGYKQNLFLDGYMKWSVQEANATYQRYLVECIGADYAVDLMSTIESRLDALGIDRTKLEDSAEFRETKWVDRDQLTNSIQEARTQRDTYTGPNQCEAEADVLILCNSDDAFFVSQSVFLNRLSPRRKNVVWSPQAMYQFLGLFCETTPDANLLHQCLTQEFSVFGFDVIDKDVVASFAEPLIRQARMELDQQREEYVAALGAERTEQLREAFEATPDYEKPFYGVAQAYLLARRQSADRQAADKRAAMAESKGQLSEKERRLFDRLKARADEKLQRHQRNRRRADSRRRRK